MKALLCKAHGSPRDLVVENTDPPALAPGQVRVAVRACGVNFPDVLMVAGRYQVQPPLPFSPGAEVAGDVIEAGDGVSSLRPGQRVLAMCGFGGMAEQVCVPAHAAIPIPDSMPYETAAGFILAYGTAYHALKQRAGLKAGESLLVLGAAGGVGLAAVELGRLMGARVIAAASSPEKLALAEKYGAENLVDYTRETLRDRVRDLTGGKGADVIYDPVGGDLFDQCLRSVAWNGRLLVVGFASGVIPQIPANLTLLKGSSVVGVFWGRFAEEQPEASRKNNEELLELYASGKLHPYISQTFDLDHAADALATLAERRATGKVVVTV